MAVNGAEFLTHINFTGYGLILGYIIFSAMLNFLITSGSAKWAIEAPIFIPMFMQLIVKTKVGKEMKKERYELGLKIRRQVLGDDYVDRALNYATDFNRPLQELVTEYCWGPHGGEKA